MFPNSVCRRWECSLKSPWLAVPSGTCRESKLQIKCLIEKFTPCSKATNIRESRGCFKEMGQISEMISNRDHLFETAQEQHPKATGRTTNGDDATTVISAAPNASAEVSQPDRGSRHTATLRLSAEPPGLSVRDGFGGRGTVDAGRTARGSPSRAPFSWNTFST